MSPNACMRHLPLCEKESLRDGTGVCESYIFRVSVLYVYTVQGLLGHFLFVPFNFVTDAGRFTVEHCTLHTHQET